MRKANKANLSPEAVRGEIIGFVRSDPRIRQLCVVAAMPFAGAALWNWGWVLALAWLSEASASKIIYIAACILIAGRQHAFFALTHEATHYRIFANRRWNDIFSNCLFAYPVFFDTEAYRQNHSQHHAHLNTEQDPDWVRKVHLPQWQFPQRLSYVAKSFPGYLLWNGPKEWLLVVLHLSHVLPLRNLRKRENLQRLMVRALYYGAAAIALSLASGGWLFLKYWLVPLFFVFPSLQRVRSVSEHFGLARTHELNSSRNVLAPWYERMLFAPHNVNYHLAHHLIATVPFYHLPRLQSILRENPVYREYAHENSSYLFPSAYPLARDLFAESAPAPASEHDKAA